MHLDRVGGSKGRDRLAFWDLVWGLGLWGSERFGVLGLRVSDKGCGRRILGFRVWDLKE